MHTSEAIAQNILLTHSNNPIVFDKVDAPVISEAVTQLIKISDERIKKIVEVSKDKQTISNILLATDELYYNLSDLQQKLGLIAATYTDDTARDIANSENDKLSVYAINILLNEPLYKALKYFETSASAKNLNPSEKKFIHETILSFEKNGMKLNPEERKKLEAINKKAIELGSAFDKNIAESKDSVQFTLDQLKGIPQDVLDTWKTADGNYVVYVNGPNYIKISQYAEGDYARRTMYIHYNNRAFPTNMEVLDSLFYYRDQMAHTLGYKSYAEYALVDEMAKTPETVWKFQNDLVEKLSPLVTKELTVLKDLKKHHTPTGADSLFAWDISYYSKMLLDTKYKLNTDEVKEYFEMNNTLTGMFRVYEKLFSIQIKETKNLPVWFSKVQTYEILMDGKVMGYFYLDLFPRKNKFTHFACFGISQYRKADGKEVLPVSALVCNFTEGTASTPSLLNHSEVTTLFHEFGHLVHSMLGRSELASQGPFSVKGDFVEAPSQFLENWCWEYESLKMFAKNYKTGEVLPESLFKKMKETQLVNTGIYYIRQLYLGMLDFTYEDKYPEVKAKGIDAISKELYKMTQLPYPEGSHFICSFGHLNGYAANYYGYLWSRVFAEDMFSVFEKEGVMNTSLGKKYRDGILGKASTMDEMDILRNFLGREPNQIAFLKSLGVK